MYEKLSMSKKLLKQCVEQLDFSSTSYIYSLDNKKVILTSTGFILKNDADYSVYMIINPIESEIKEILLQEGMREFIALAKRIVSDLKDYSMTNKSSPDDQ